MRPHRILPWPDPRLGQPAAPVAEITDDIRAIWDEMIQVMDAMPGLGLAAPQIGVMLRLAVVDASNQRGRAMRIANPEIIDLGAPMATEIEASPNLPGVQAKVTRPARIGLRYTDHIGMVVRTDLEGMWARSAQHQVDHLNGMLFVERLSRTKRDMLLKKARKRVR